MIVALDYLSDLEKAQLRHTRPDIFHQCPRCHYGQVIAGQCLQCSHEEKEEEGEENGTKRV